MEDHIERTFLLEDLCFGGTQRQNVELALRLDRARFRPAILTLTGPTDLDRKVLDGNITPLSIWVQTAKRPRFFARLGSAIRKLRPDVIIPARLFQISGAGCGAKVLHIPVLGTVRGGGAPMRQHERFYGLLQPIQSAIQGRFSM